MAALLGRRCVGWRRPMLWARCQPTFTGYEIHRTHAGHGMPMERTEIAQHRIHQADSRLRSSYRSLMGERHAVLLHADPPYCLLVRRNKQGRARSAKRVKIDHPPFGVSKHRGIPPVYGTLDATRARVSRRRGACDCLDQSSGAGSHLCSGRRGRARASRHVSLGQARQGGQLGEKWRGCTKWPSSSGGVHCPRVVPMTSAPLAILSVATTSKARPRPGSLTPTISRFRCWSRCYVGTAPPARLCWSRFRGVGVRRRRRFGWACGAGPRDSIPVGKGLRRASAPGGGRGRRIAPRLSCRLGWLRSRRRTRVPARASAEQHTAQSARGSGPACVRGRERARRRRW